jgi:hypothetical protein
MNSPDRRAACSVITANHLPRARVLVESLHRHTPALPVFVLVVDDVAGRFEPEGEDFTVVSYEALAVPHSQFLRFAYPAQGVCSTAKPYLLRYLLRQGYAELLYLDADLFVVGDLSPLFDRLAGYSVLLTPHLTEPVPNGARAEEEPLHAGCFNAGFIGVHAGPSADRFLSWWADRVYPTAREFVWEADGYDQRWLDLAPGLVDGLHVVRDPGCNVAHWICPHAT